MLGAKKEQLETGSGAHKIERIRLATGVAEPAVAVAREGRVIRYLAVQTEAAEPAAGT
jgi:hypothetical protein